MTDYVKVHGHNYYMPYVTTAQGNKIVFFGEQYHKNHLEAEDKLVGEYDPDRKVIHPIITEQMEVVGKKGQTLDSLLFGANIQ